MSYRARPGAEPASPDAVLARLLAVVPHPNRRAAAEAAGIKPGSLCQWLRVGSRLHDAVRLANARVEGARRRLLTTLPKLSHNEVLELERLVSEPWVVRYARKRGVR